MIIAIDGPAAAGKSTVARTVASELSIRFLDTGSMYRAMTLAVLRAGVDPSDAAACAEVARGVRLGFDEAGKILINGEAGEPEIRSSEVSRAVSPVSAHPPVRALVVPLQRVVAETETGVVAEGRDTTTVVFPDADLKFFLWASAEVRAQRRANELGAPERRQEIQEKIERRDRLDSERAESPLRQAEDAIRIDTGTMEASEVVSVILGHVRARA